MPSAMSSLVSAIDWKVPVQLAFGGLAGVLFKYFLDKRLLRKKLERLRVHTRRSDYSAAVCDTSLGAVRISYGAKTFDNLLLYEFELINISDSTARDPPF